MRLGTPDLGAIINLLLLQEGESGRGRGRGRGRGGFRGRSNFRGGRGGFRGGFRFVIDNYCRARVGLGPWDIIELDAGVDSAEGSVEVEAEAKVEVVTEEMMEELQEVASEAVEKVAEEVEASEEGRAGVVEKEEAGEVIAEPPRARARPNVFSMTCRQRTTKSHLHHISTKKFVTPSVLATGHQYHHQSPCV